MDSEHTFVVDTSHSQYAKLRPVPIEAVSLQDSFWAPRLRLLREFTLPSQYEHCKETGRISNFLRAAGKADGAFQGFYFNDSDVYKWVEALAFSHATTNDQRLYELLKQTIGDISAAQDEDGYLNTYFTFDRKKERWTNLREKHELYCSGHLMQAAIAFHRSTGDKEFLEVAIRLANHICSVFGPGEREGTPGHPEIEMALVELYRTTGNQAFLEMAGSFLDNRGKGIVGGSVYLIDHKPFRELTEIVGHAVRSIYLNCGAADIYMETGETALRDTLERLWRSMTERRMYVTGGVGARYEGEAFGVDYELPNERAYAETCSAIANVMWNWRMLLMSGEGRFGDVLELALYNGALAGISLDGRHYFYVNPLADRGSHRRQEWFDCACCPPNIARLLASLPGYFYALSVEGIWVNLYARSVAHIRADGTLVTIEQRTDYPWNGEVDLIVQPEKEVSFRLYLRIPAWSRNAQVEVNDQAMAVDIKPGEFFGIYRSWESKDRVHLSFSMPIEEAISHPRVAENAGKVVLKRGPIVYCVEQVENHGFDVWDLVLPIDAGRLKVDWAPTLLGGVMIIGGEAMAIDSDWQDHRLYCGVTETFHKGRQVRFTAIPYYAWANQGPGAMAVWMKSFS